MEVDEFLEHFGVAGQKWGVRNTKPASPSSRVGSPQDHARRNRNLKIIGAALGTAALIGGTFFAVKYLRGSGNFPISRMGKTELMPSIRKVAGKQAAEKIIHDSGSKVLKTAKVVQPKRAFNLINVKNITIQPRTKDRKGPAQQMIGQFTKRLRKPTPPPLPEDPNALENRGSS